MKESKFRLKVETLMMPFGGARIQDAAADAALKIAKEAGAKFDPEGPPVVPKLAWSQPDSLRGRRAGASYAVHAENLCGLSDPEAQEIVRRASEERETRLRELAAPTVHGADYRGRLDLIRRILEGEE